MFIIIWCLELGLAPWPFGSPALTPFSLKETEHKKDSNEKKKFDKGKSNTVCITENMFTWFRSFGSPIGIPHFEEKSLIREKIL